MTDKKELLDQPDEPIENHHSHWFGQYFPAGLFVIALALGWFHIQGAKLLMVIALVLASVRMVVRFFRKSRAYFEWCYFLGNLSLMVILSLSVFGAIPPGLVTFSLPLILFLLGILFAGRQK